MKSCSIGVCAVMEAVQANFFSKNFLSSFSTDFYMRDGDGEKKTSSIIDAQPTTKILVERF